MKNTVSQKVNILYDPLSATLGINEKGGGLKQVYYAGNKEFAPDRTLTPLILEPYYFITDPHGEISQGDKIQQLSSGKWFENGNPITTGLDYEVLSDFSLKVKKNSEQALVITFEGEYLDIRTNSIIPVSLQTLLTCTSNAGVEPVAKIQLDKPLAWGHHSTKGEKQYIINSTAFKGGKETDLPIKWYVLINDVEVDVTETLFYVSGQDTSSLIVDSSYMDKEILRARSGDIYAETKFVRSIPDSAFFNLVMPDKLDARVQQFKAIASIGTHLDGVLDNPSEFFFIKWYINKNTPGSTNIEVGHGNEVVINRKDIGLNGTVGYSVEELEAYRAMTDNDGNVIVDNEDNIITIR